jgi:hypothetical protein
MESGIDLLKEGNKEIKLDITQNKELHNLYSSPDIIRQVKSSQGE